LQQQQKNQQRSAYFFHALRWSIRKPQLGLPMDIVKKKQDGQGEN
jgi:hypothetical protein